MKRQKPGLRVLHTDIWRVVIPFLRPRAAAALGATTSGLRRLVAAVVFEPLLVDWDACVWDAGSDNDAHEVGFLMRVFDRPHTFRPREEDVEVSLFLQHCRPSAMTAAFHRILAEMVLSPFLGDMFCVLPEVDTDELNTLRGYRAEVCEAALPTFRGLCVPRALMMQRKVAAQVSARLLDEWAVESGVTRHDASAVAQHISLLLTVRRTVRDQIQARWRPGISPHLNGALKFLHAHGATSAEDAAFAAELRWSANVSLY